jgi:adenylate cyclase
MTEPVTILAVDDQPANLRLLDAVLSPRGYRVVRATSGEQALELLPSSGVDLVLLDIVMPGIDGYEVCRRIRRAPETAFLPVVMITASGHQEKTRAIEAGADDFVSKPFDQSELLARVASLARIKRYHDTITEQAAELLINSGDDSLLGSHRREIVVVFCDLRGFTAFAESSEPEEVMGVLREYHAALGELIFRYEGTLERFTGDGLMVFFNDPIPLDDPTQRAVEMALAMRDRVAGLVEGWSRLGHDLGFGVGIAQGFATLGRIGYEGRFDYAAIGTVTNLAARLCGEADAGQVLVSQRVFGAVEAVAAGEPVGALELKGFSRPIRAFRVSRMINSSAEVPS